MPLLNALDNQIELLILMNCDIFCAKDVIRLKNSILSVLIISLCLVFFTGCSDNVKTGVVTSTIDNSGSLSHGSDQDLSESVSSEETSDAPSATPSPDISSESKNLYHSNDQIEHLLTSYNAVAEYQISADMVSEGAYPSSANISCNNVNIRVNVNDAGDIFVDYQIEAADDTAVKPLFRDFCKALDSNVTNEDVETAWKALQTKEYQNYNSYKFNEIECTYSVSMQLSNGDYRFTVKSNG